MCSIYVKTFWNTYIFFLREKTMQEHSFHIELLKCEVISTGKQKELVYDIEVQLANAEITFWNGYTSSVAKCGNENFFFE